MAFSGGVFSLVSGNPVSTATTISSTWANNTLSDIATNGLSLCVLKDGSQTLTANLPMSSFKLTGLGAGNTNGDSLRYEQLFTSGLVTLLGTLKAPTTVGVGAATPAATGSGVSFPATQSDSNDVNTLDDYEEGTWSPGISFAGGTTGITYTTQVATYTKIGNRVFFSAYVVLSNKGSSTGAAALTGLPFTSNATANRYGVCAASALNLASITTNALIYIIAPNATTISLDVLSSGSATAMTDANFANNTEIIASGHYSV